MIGPPAETGNDGSSNARAAASNHLHESGFRRVLLLKNIVFTVIAPGILAILIPSGIVLSRRPTFVPESWGAQQYLALLPASVGALVYLRCLWDFVSVGKCTPMLFDEPKALIVRGFYRYVRNPIYLAVLLVLLGEAVLFESFALLGYAAGVLAFFHLVVVVLEEPWLRGTFGESYQRYCQSVRRWVPGKRYRETA